MERLGRGLGRTRRVWRPREGEGRGGGRGGDREGKGDGDHGCVVVVVVVVVLGGDCFWHLQSLFGWLQTSTMFT